LEFAANSSDLLASALSFSRAILSAFSAAIPVNATGAVAVATIKFSSKVSSVVLFDSICSSELTFEKIASAAVPVNAMWAAAVTTIKFSGKSALRIFSVLENKENIFIAENFIRLLLTPLLAFSHKSALLSFSIVHFAASCWKRRSSCGDIGKCV